MQPSNYGFQQEPPKNDWIDYKLTLAILLTALILFAADWSSGRSSKSSRNPAPEAAAAPVPQAQPQTLPEKPKEPKEKVRPLSGRQLTIEKMQKPKIPAQHFAEDVYGVSFDAPQGYLVKEGELPDMDLGLGYLGSLPMEFSEPGGVRVATVEVPRGAHPGTDFVNAFLTVNAFPNATAEQCSLFSPALGYSEPPLRQKISGIDFTGIPNSEAASLHQYFGKYFHGYSQGTCYEVGYGIVTAAASHDGLKRTNNDAVLRKLERILNSLAIKPRQDEEPVSSPETEELDGVTPLDQK